MENRSGSAIEIGRYVRRNRLTGETLTEGAPIYAIDYPFHSPDPAVITWRYLDWFKFEDLVINRRLYFRRADRLDDQMEGRFSEANRRFQTALSQRFHEAHGLQHNPDQERASNELIRPRVFINCWHINGNESARMWKLYTKSADSVVIRSRCDLLHSSSDGRAHPPLLVRYVGQDEPRPEYHSLAPFIFKGPCFNFENEVRLLLEAGSDESISLDGEEDFFRYLPLRPEDLILEIRTHPAASKRIRRKVENLCGSHLPNLRLRRSALDRKAVS